MERPQLSVRVVRKLSLFCSQSQSHCAVGGHGKARKKTHKKEAHRKCILLIKSYSVALLGGGSPQTLSTLFHHILLQLCCIVPVAMNLAYRVQ